MSDPAEGFQPPSYMVTPAPNEVLPDLDFFRKRTSAGHDALFAAATDAENGREVKIRAVAALTIAALTAVVGGMLAATVFSVLFVPSFFVLFQRIAEWGKDSESG